MRIFLFVVVVVLKIKTMMMKKAEGDKNTTKNNISATINKRNSILLTHLLFVSVQCQQGADFSFCFLQ